MSEAGGNRCPIRCAIYTRKSSDEGLDQDFNSLDAQYEACAAYVASQKHEGWKLVSERYDDGGVSGGTLERPGLKRLLADIEAGAVQMIVVYKIDRLTRSLADFARLIDQLEAAGCSFVSVTQAFNTSSSMGRLTLNVLLSFAQFEREVTAERIRDKLAASKKKGMWMGGLAPLGYDGRDRALHVNEVEAAIVREIFSLYLDRRNVADVEAVLRERNIRTKRRVFESGRTSGGAPFTRGGLYHLLSNPVYIGQIRHKDILHDGRHKAIIDAETWLAAQSILAANTQGQGERQKRNSGNSSRAERSPLAGKVRDETGDRQTPSHAVKSGRRYRYYVSSRLLTGRSSEGEGWRLSARELERAVADRVAEALRHPHAASRLLADAPASTLASASVGLGILAETFAGPRRDDALARLIASVRIAPGCLFVDLDPTALAGHLELDLALLDPQALHLEAFFTCRKRGVETRLVMADPSARQDPVLIRAVAKAHAWWRALRSGTPMKAIAEAEGISQRRVAHLMALAFLAPDITEAILEGRQPAALTLETLIRNPVPVCWNEQRQMLALRRG